MRHRRLNRSTLIESRASAMRAAPTASEAALWRAISGRKLGVQFRRQVPLGRFIVDFFASSAGLAVEVDGGYHTERRAADARRDRALARMGYRVVRLDEQLVRGSIEEAVARVRAALSAAP
jgi:very-short-patch-repair endonuclease